MFNPKESVRPLAGRLLTYEELCKELASIYKAHFHELSPDFNVRRFIEILDENKWLHEDVRGNLKIVLDATPEVSGATR